MAITVPTMPVQSRLPRYLRVLNAMRDDLASGKYGERLPSEPELAPRYGVSRMTLRRAISALVEEGLLDSRQGTGTFVRRQTDGEPPRIIGLLVSPHIQIGVNDPYLRQLSHSLLEACASRGWTLRLAPDVESMGIRLGAGRGASMAACIATAFGSDDVKSLRNLPVPLVLIDSEPLTGVQTVLPENSKSIRIAVKRLVELGHSAIAHLAGPDVSPSARERHAAFLAGMTEARIQTHDLSVKVGDYSDKAGYQAMAAWWKSSHRPTAVICANDRMALGAMHWLIEHDVKIPKEVSIIGFDGLDSCDIIRPSLSTLSMDFPAHAQLALQCVTSPTDNNVIRSPVQLVERQSLGPVSGRNSRRS